MTNKLKQHDEKNYETMTTTIFCNHSELSYAEEANIAHSKHPARILVPERFIRKGKNKKKLMLLPNSFIQQLVTRNYKLKEKYPSSEIVCFLQFGKGSTLTNAQLNAISSVEEGADVNLLYEKNRRQSSLSYVEQLQAFNIRSTKKKAVVLEVESKNVEKKVAEALNAGIKDFYFLAGMYKNVITWKNLIEPIKGTGRSTAILLKRYNAQKKSYIVTLLDFGCDHVVHGSPSVPPLEKKFDILFLDSDWKYKKIELIQDENIRSIVQNCPAQQHYFLSRALAIDKANDIIKLVHLNPIV